MGAMKRWRTLGGGDHSIFKFETPGQSLEGIWRGIKMNKFNNENGMIETPDGHIHEFSLAAMLKDLIKLPEGTEVEITYLGLKPGKNYGWYKTRWAELMDEPHGDQPRDEEVPF